MSDSLRSQGSQHARFLCPRLSPGVCSTSCPLGQCFYLTISSSAAIFAFCLQSFPASWSFPMSQLLETGSQSIGTSASASVLSMTIQGWFPLGLIGLISLLSNGLSRVFSISTVWDHQVFCTQPSLWPNLTSIHDYWKNHSFDYTDLCQQCLCFLIYPCTKKSLKIIKAIVYIYNVISHLKVLRERKQEKLEWKVHVAKSQDNQVWISTNLLCDPSLALWGVLMTS